MQQQLLARPQTPVEPVTEIFHGTEVTDPYRWLENQDSPKTRTWLVEQSRYARAYLERIPERHKIKERIRELLCVETHGIPQKIGDHYFFLKRSATKAQPSIYMRAAGEAEDALLVDPASIDSDPYTSVSISHISLDGRFLLYEIKRGGERSGRFEILDIEQRRTLPESLPRGFLRGFLFSQSGEGFYYLHETVGAERPCRHAAYYHSFGSPFAADEEIFCGDESPNVRVLMTGNYRRLCFTSIRIEEHCRVDYYLYDLSTRGPAKLALSDTGHIPGLVLWEDRVFAMTDLNAPLMRIVEMPVPGTQLSRWREIVPEASIQMASFTISKACLLVKYVSEGTILVGIFDLEGNELHHASFPNDGTATVQLNGSSADEIFYKWESFTNAPAILRYLPQRLEHEVFAQSAVPFDTTDISSIRLSYRSKDGTLVPMYLVGKQNLSPKEPRPTILTGYGGFGMSMTPRFGILTSFMIEQGCLLAVTCLRGGFEFGKEWHLAARGKNRQNAFDDFLSAAEWLIASGYTSPDKLAIFGGSNSGLLVGAALTQRPDLFRAVLCFGPLLDMLRYQYFDFARQYRFEYGIAEDPGDFAALYSYSPYHRVQNGTAYPGVMLVSGDMDMNCNPMHARKMTARLQTASTSGHPVILDYKPMRGHKPVMPLMERIEGLTDRLSFLCDQLGVSVKSDTKQTVRGGQL